MTARWGLLVYIRQTVREDLSEQVAFELGLERLGDKRAEVFKETLLTRENSKHREMNSMCSRDRQA